MFQHMGMNRSIVAGFVCLLLAGCSSVDLADQSIAEGGDPVTQWTLIADFYGRGNANWRTLAIMHRAMHDALNAAHPVYARWDPPQPGEPAPEGAVPEAAMAAAAYQVLNDLEPERIDETQLAFKSAMARIPDGPGKQAGIRLGIAIGDEAVQNRAHDGYENSRLFAGSDQPGRWRPVPPTFSTSGTNDTRPFLFATAAEVLDVAPPPPRLGSAVFIQELEESRRLGAANGSDRTPSQTFDALFWANQSSQRGFVYLAVKLLAAHPRPGGVYEHARIMSQLTAALADSAILTWEEKEKFSFWRPITAIAAAHPELANTWTPLINTPPFPEYPSGHAADCYTGAGILETAFPGLNGPVLYIASTYIPPLRPDAYANQTPGNFGMGQHAQIVGDIGPSLTFPSLAAAAENCALSRIWAGAHFHAADNEANRLANLIDRRAAASVPVLK
jgi:hypothetical protein